jgi:predicted deacylase
MEAQIVNADEFLDRGVGKRLGQVELPKGSGGAIRAVPLAVIAGPHAGPTAWVNAALHGDEYLGPAAVARLVADLDSEAIHGRLILTPTLNPGGTRAMQRTDPAHGVDLNRAWSAPPGGPAAETVAWARATLLARSDVVIDLHSGGNRFLQHPFAVFPEAGDRVSAASAALAKACGIPWIWAHRDSILNNALITAAAREGKPAVLLEIAGEGKAETSWTDDMVAAIRGALAEARVLRETPRYRSSYRVFASLEVVRNREEGLWRRAAEPGDPLLKGDPLGCVLDLLGRELEVVRSPRDAAVAGICTYGYVPQDDYVGEIASGFREEGPPA